MVRWHKGPMEEARAVGGVSQSNVTNTTLLAVVEFGVIIIYATLVAISLFDGFIATVPSSHELLNRLLGQVFDHLIVIVVHIPTCIMGFLKPQSCTTFFRFSLFFLHYICLIVDVFFILIRIGTLNTSSVVVGHALFTVAIMIFTGRMFAIKFGIRSHIDLLQRNNIKNNKNKIQFGFIKTTKMKLLILLVIWISITILTIEIIIRLFKIPLSLFFHFATSVVYWYSFPLTMLLLCLFLLDVFALYLIPASSKHPISLKELKINEDSDDNESRVTSKIASRMTSKVTSRMTSKAPSRSISRTASRSNIKEEITTTREKGLVALLIACYKSESIIMQTLRAAILAGIPCQDIYVCHNGNQDQPIDNTGHKVHQFCKKHNLSVNYLWLPEGNKTITMYYVVKNYCGMYPYILMTDDDVQLPLNMDLKGPIEKFQSDPNIKACAYTIRCGKVPPEFKEDNDLNDDDDIVKVQQQLNGNKKSIWTRIENITKSKEGDNILVGLQSLEYLLAGYIKLFQSTFGSTLSHHGAIGLWDRQSLIEVLDEHNSMFDGEDLQMGILLHIQNKNYKIITNAVTPAYTQPPTNWFYESKIGEKSLARQRIFSWDITTHRYIFQYLKLLLFYWNRNILILKPFLIDEVLTIIEDYLRVVSIIYLSIARPAVFIQLIMGMILFQYCIVLIFDFVILHHRPSLRTRPLVLFLFPFYRILLLLFRFIALVLNLLLYTPWIKNTKTIRTRNIRDTLPPKIPLNHLKFRRDIWSKLWVTENTSENGLMPPSTQPSTMNFSDVNNSTNPQSLNLRNTPKKHSCRWSLVFCVSFAVAVEVLILIILPYLFYVSHSVDAVNN